MINKIAGHVLRAKQYAETNGFNLGKVLKDWRWANKFTTRQAASMVGISHTALFRLEHGKEISSDNLRQVIRWLLF
jgi:hypothetical protein